MSDLGRIGIWSMELRTGSAEAVGDAAAELDDLGYLALWIPGLDGPGTIAQVEVLLGATRRATIATGVLGLWSQPPGQLAADHHRLTAAHGPRLLTGIGVSNADSARSKGQTYPGAVTAMTDYLDRIDAATDPIPQSERVLAALGPKMTKLAAERASGSHPFLVTPQYVANSRELGGRDMLLAPHQIVVLDDSPSEARQTARGMVGAALGLPSYQANVRRMGFGDDDLASAGSDRLIDAVVVWGDLDAIAERIREHFDAGADHVALQVLAVPGGLTTAEVWRELASLI
jgi:probable F420-dependent oxidoreductase